MRKLYLLLFIVEIPSAKSESSKLPNLAANIANSQFEHNLSTSVVWWQSDPNEVTDFLVEYQGSVNTIDVETLKLTKTITFRQAVLFISSTKEFSYFLTKIDTSIIIPSKVIVLFTETNKKPQNLSIITQAAWDNDITDIILMSLDDAGQIVEIFTYYPYNINKPCGCTSAVAVDPNSVNFFPPKFNDFNRCPLKMQANSNPPITILECVNGRSQFISGIFGDTVTLIATKLNASLVVICSQSRMTSEGRLELLKKKEIDMSITYVTESFLRLTQLTTVHYFSSIVWCGPPRREIYAWAKVIVPLISNISALLLASFIAVVIILKIIHRFEPCKKKKSPEIIFQTFAIFLGQTANYVSKSPLTNAIFVMWIWFCLVVSIIYQGELVRGLQTKLLEPPLETLDGAVPSVDGYGGTKLFVPYVNGTSLGEKYKVLDYFVALSHLTEMIQGKRFLLISDWVRLKAYPSLQRLKEPVMLQPLTLTARPHWGGAAAATRLERRAAAAGLFQRLLNDEADAARRERELRADGPDAKGDIAPLSLITLSTCFFFLAIMWVVCIIVLCIEFLYKIFFTPSFNG